jgi:hypothetical protein
VFDLNDHFNFILQDLDSAAAALLVTQKLLEKQSAQMIVPPSPDKRDTNAAMPLPSK